jgi:hypothetical protein
LIGHPGANIAEIVGWVCELGAGKAEGAVAVLGYQALAMRDSALVEENGVPLPFDRAT